MIPYIDAHTHNRNERDNVIAIVNLDYKDVAQTLPQHFSIGIHPWDVSTASHISQIESLATHPQCIAIGESGIDRLYPDIEDQKSLFIQHLNLAKKLEKPLIIHGVKSYSDILEIIKKENFRFPFLLHDYNGNEETTTQLLNYNCYFGYGSKIKRSTTKAFKSFKKTPRHKILLETDDSDYLIEEIYRQAKYLRHDISNKVIAMNFKCFKGGS